MDYVFHILILIAIYAILTMSLNLIAGVSGLLSLAHAAFYGLGAYTVALLALKMAAPFWVALPVAVVVCGVSGAIIGIPSLRIRGDYFVIATFAFQVLVFSVLNNWVTFTGGPMGLPGIPQPAAFGCKVSSPSGFLVFVGCFCLVAFWVCHRIVRSPFGRALKAIREDEVFAQAAGKNVAAYKVLVFVVGAAMAALAGATYAYYITFIDPTSFTVMESIFIISIVIIGGAGSLRGPVVGAVVLVTLPELLRFVGLPSPVAANVRQILYGGALIAFMMWRPQGLLGEYGFEKKSAEA